MLLHAAFLPDPRAGADCRDATAREWGVIHSRCVNLWIPDVAGREAVGELPPEVTLGLIPERGSLPAAIADAEFLVPHGHERMREAIPRMRGLRVIQTISAGVDWLLPLVPTGVRLCDAGGARDVGVAEWVLAGILASVRTLPELRDAQREHRWAWRQSGELAGSTALILGYGSIGAAVEGRLAPMGVEVIRVARSAREGVHAVAELGGLLPFADIVIVLLPLTEQTTGLLDAGLLARMRPGALLVNAARGPIIDAGALLELLLQQRIRAVLDVTDPEPLPADHPLWDAPNVLITPHYAGATLQGERRAFELVGEQVRRYVRGEELLNAVQHGY